MFRQDFGGGHAKGGIGCHDRNRQECFQRIADKHIAAHGPWPQETQALWGDFKKWCPCLRRVVLFC